MKKILKIFLLIILYVVFVGIILIATGSIKIELNQKINKKTIDEYINNGLSLDDDNLNESNGKIDNYYYKQLSQTAKKIYSKIIENEEFLLTGTSELKFKPNEFNDILEKENGMDILSTEYQNAIDALRYDHIELFYIDFSKTILKTITYTRGNTKEYEVSITKKDDESNYFLDSIEDKEMCQSMLKNLNYKTTELTQNATGNNYKKIQYIHNYLIDTITYDKTYNKENARNIYGALIQQEVVCEGYAKSFKYLLDQLNIPCIIVSGKAMNSEGTLENHMWNYVLINNIWYSVDCTWDDPIIINGNELTDELRYKYFCQGDNINQNHYLSETITDNCQKWIYPELYHKEI